MAELPERTFVVLAGEQVGPFTPRQVVEKIDAGELTPETLGWASGMKEWQPLATWYPVDLARRQEAERSQTPHGDASFKLGLVALGLYVLFVVVAVLPATQAALKTYHAPANGRTPSPPPVLVMLGLASMAALGLNLFGLLRAALGLAAGERPRPWLSVALNLFPGLVLVALAALT